MSLQCNTMYLYLRENIHGYTKKHIVLHEKKIQGYIKHFTGIHQKNLQGYIKKLLGIYKKLRFNVSKYIYKYFSTKL